uniref:uncharacterized protein LOC122584717 n=1 Tax=Erigeron canadensis TaxID=72917 RepID=UPI001CB88F27|nr:uncharacterized protein LOC122584717 [Erigeron canadensis]
MASVSKEVNAAILLPDKIVVRIFNKTDLKTLFNCKRVSKRFYQIACEVDTITFVAPSRWTANNPVFRRHARWLAVYSHKKFSSSTFGWRFGHLVGGLIDSMKKFTRLRSLYIELPLSSIKGLPHLKWKVFIDSNRIGSFVLLASTSIYDTKGSSSVDDREEEGLSNYMSPIGNYTAEICMENAFVRYLMLLGLARECPFLEKISITDPRKRGRISLSGAKLSEVRNSFTSIGPPDEVDKFISKVEQGMSSRGRVSGCDIPLLYLRDSGFIMKGVKLNLYSYEEPASVDEEDSKEDDFEDSEEEATYGDFEEQDDLLPYEYEYSYDGYINIGVDFEDKEEAAFSEALMEIFNKHSDRIRGPGYDYLPF